MLSCMYCTINKSVTRYASGPYITVTGRELGNGRNERRRNGLLDGPNIDGRGPILLETKEI